MTLNPIKWYTGIRELFAIKGAISNMKLSELSTSEGRLTILLNLIAVYSAVQGFLPANVTAWISVASVAAYTIGRAVVKAGEAIAPLTATDKDDKAVAEVKAVLDTFKKE